MADSLRGAQEAAGAAFGEVAGAEVARGYGDAAAEYRAVREGAGLAARGDLATLRMWGRDPVKMLQGLITNDLAGAPGGQAVYAAMLTPKGRTIAELRALARQRPDGTEVLILLPREALDGTRAHLQKFVPPMFARWADVSEGTAALGIYGPAARAALGSALGEEVPELAEDAWTERTFGGETVLVVGSRETGEEGFDLLAPAAAAPALWEALRGAGARPVGFGALETLRVEAGRPRYGHELTEEVIPTEAFEPTGLMPRAISFHKGCYTGQEVIVRIAHRGHVNRLLRGLRLGAAAAPAPSTPLHHPESGKEVGRITSTAHSPRLGETVALGFVRRELAPGERVRVGAPDGPEAEVAALPFAP